MGITEYLSESLEKRVVETDEKLVKSATKKLLKYFNKEQFDLTSNGGYKSIKKDGKTMFCLGMKMVLDEAFRTSNFSELIDKNPLPKGDYKFKEDKNKKYFDVIFVEAQVIEYAQKVSEVCKWDADVIAAVFTNIFKENGVTFNVVGTNINESKESTLGFYSMGNGITVADKSRKRGGDYVTIAHISDDGERITWRKDKPTKEQDVEIRAFADKKQKSYQNK